MSQCVKSKQYAVSDSPLHTMILLYLYGSLSQHLSQKFSNPLGKQHNVSHMIIQADK